MIEKIKTSYPSILFILLVVVVFVVYKDSIFKPKTKKIINPNLTVAQQIKDSCEQDLETYSTKENCFANKFREMAEENGPEYSFDVLRNLQEIDRDAIGCHSISHGIGTGSYKRDPDSWRTLIQTLPTVCSYGAPHGVIEGYVASLPNHSLSKEVIPTICGEVPRADCNHIVGHLILVETEADLDKALDLCDLFKDVTQTNHCISGVFMEYQTAINLIDHRLVPESWQNWPARVDDLEKVCRSYNGARAEGCWEEIVHAALAKFNNDPKKIFDFCSSAQVPEGSKRCKRHSIGIIGASVNFDLFKMKLMCSIPQKDDPDFERDCYTASVSSALSTIPSALPQAVSFCSSLKNEFKQDCFSMIGAMNFSGSREQNSNQVNACKKAPSEFRNFCLGGVSSLGNPIFKNSNN